MKAKGFRHSASKIITAIDIGSSKVCCIIAEARTSQSKPVILGMGHHGIQGKQKGFAANMETVEHAVLNAVHKAERQANLTIKQAIINISGPHLVSEVVKVSGDIQGQTVEESDIRYLLEQATQNQKSSPFSILHVNPIKFSVDQGRPTKNPRGVYGKKLTAYLHMVTGELNLARTLVRCLKRCHIQVQALVPTPIASGFSTLVEDEMDLGVILIDFGSHNTHVALFMNGEVLHTESIPIGGAHITNDLAQGLSTSLTGAERIKILHGSAIETNEDSRVIVEVPQVEGSSHDSPTQVRRSLVTAIVKPRVEEILELVKKRLEKNDVYKIASRRVVLTGGGSQLPGLRELTHQILQKQSRLGKPLDTLTSRETYTFPSFSTCTGLLTFALRQNYAGQGTTKGKTTWLESLAKWFKENF